MPDTDLSRESKQTFEPNTLIVEDDFLRHGFIQLPKILLYARNLSRDAKLLYAILLGYAWQEQRCWPGYGRLCEDMGASENMVRKYMRELEEIGLLRQKRRGQGRPNLYTLPNLRTSKIEVLEPQFSQVLEPQFSQDKVYTVNNIQGEKNQISNSSKAPRSDASSGASGDVIGATVAQPQRLDNGMPTPIGDVLEARAPKRPRRKRTEYLDRVIEDFSGELGDAAHAPSNLAQARTLFQRMAAKTGVDEKGFVDYVYRARAETRQAANVRKKMAYFFAVLRDLLGLVDEDHPLLLSEEDLDASLDVRPIDPPTGGSG